MNKKLSSLLAVSAVAGVALLAPQEAQAKRPGVLEGKPIVVDRLELRKMRFQVTPRVGMSLSQPFVHVGTVGGKLQFDFLDWLGVRAGFDFGMVPLDAKLLKGINDGALPTATEGTVDRPSSELDNPAPLLHDFQSGLTRLAWTSSIDVAFTPFSGKMGLFSSIFTEYDIYVFGGLGITSWKRHYPNATSTSDALGIANQTDPDGVNFCSQGDGFAQNTECLLHPVKSQEGIKIGGSVGGGLHLFLNDWIAINPEVHDIMVSHNPAGLNATISDVPPQVDKDDNALTHNLMFNLGFTFYLPPKAKRSKLEATSGTDAQITAPGSDPEPTADAGGGATDAAGDVSASGTVGGEVGAPPAEPEEEEELALEDE
jgi:outer membrane beta-barrel protein